jgi:excisionase family DNA binding protein
VGVTVTKPNAAEVTVVNADSWIDYTAQLALLLSRASNGRVIPAADGNPADPERIVTLCGLPYWAENVAALHDALAELAADGDWPGALPHFGPGAAETGPERLLLTVAEAAAFLRISKAFAYVAIRRGEIPSIRIGGVIRVPRAGLEKMLDVGEPPDAN